MTVRSQPPAMFAAPVDLVSVALGLSKIARVEVEVDGRERR